LDTFVFEDLDGREGYITGSVSFGPNSINGIVDEEPITGYAVYLVDECGVQFGIPVASVAKRPGVPQGCCEHSAYTVQVNALAIPLDHGMLRLSVVPWTPAGPLPVGELTRNVFDYITPPETPAPTPAPPPVNITANNARHSTPLTGKIAVLVAFAAITAHLATPAV